MALVVQVSHLDRHYRTDIVRDRVHVNHFGDVEVRAVAVLLDGRLIGKRHLAAQHYNRSSNQHFKQFHFFSVPTMQTIYVFSRSTYGRRLYEAREGGLLGPCGLALRRFVWKLGLVYAVGDFDKSQSLEIIVVEKVIMLRGTREASLPKTSGLCFCGQVTRTCGCLVPGEKHGVGRLDAVAGAVRSKVRNGGAEKIRAASDSPASS
jgi:hypothetical protein